MLRLLYPGVDLGDYDLSGCLDRLFRDVGTGSGTAGRLGDRNDGVESLGACARSAVVDGRAGLVREVPAWVWDSLRSSRRWAAAGR